MYEMHRSHRTDFKDVAEVGVLVLTMQPLMSPACMHDSPQPPTDVPLATQQGLVIVFGRVDVRCAALSIRISSLQQSAMTHYYLLCATCC